ncbi:SMP-30/gluconolactonase/LRE family protein [Micromonosporaceae bacterium Da 78-11]
MSTGTGAGLHRRAVVASPGVYSLGEGPLWDAPRRRVLWVDVDAGAVHEGRLDGDRVVLTRSRTVDRTVGAVVCSADGDLLVAGAQSVATISGEHETVLLSSGSRRRLNDGGCDPAGRFLVGTLALDAVRGGETLVRGSETLVRLEPDGSVTTLDYDLSLSNGLAFSPDGTRLYHIDSVPGIVWTRSYDAATGATGPREEWLRITDGLPDGCCFDAEGHLWIAVWGTGEVRRYTPDAQLAGVVEVPAPHPTSVAFVGDDLDRLLITTATAELTAEQRTAYPDSGRLFLADVGVPGLPVTPWSGFPS